MRSPAESRSELASGCPLGTFEEDSDDALVSDKVKRRRCGRTHDSGGPLTQSIISTIHSALIWGGSKFGRRPASGWGAGGRAKRSVASLGGPASPEALLHTLAEEYCCKEAAQMALFQCIQVSKGTTPSH